MSGLANAILTGLGMSLPSAALAWLIARALAGRAAGAEVALWRGARIVAVLPVLLAPLVWAVPMSISDAAGHPPLPAGETRLADGAQTMRIAGADRAPGTITSPSALVASTYGAGLVLVLLLALRRHFARQTLLRASRPASRRERSVLEAMARRIGVRAPALHVTGRPISPCLTGWQGVILLPEPVMARGGDTLRYAMAHELCHLRRGDERDRLAGTALRAMLWFNPALRMIETELDAAREMACDRDTLDALGGAQRKPYAAALIETMRITAPAATAFRPHDRRHREMRIRSIITASPARRGRAAWMAATVLAGIIPVAGAQALVTDRREAAAPVEIIETRASAAPVFPREPGFEPHPVVAVAPVYEPDYPAMVEPVSAPVATAPVAPAPSVAVAPALPAFSHDVTSGRITSRYGARPGRPAGAAPFHGGYDIAAAEGTAIHAPAPGIVTHAEMGFEGSDRWGNTVAIDHGNGWVTLYAHMQAFDVQAGDAVVAGEAIGTIGTTGASTGPHVHVELRHNGERVDPAGRIPGLR